MVFEKDFFAEEVLERRGARAWGEINETGGGKESKVWKHVEGDRR